MAIYFLCDKCGLRMSANDAERFIVKIEAYAAAGPIEWSQNKDGDQAALTRVIEALRSADPDQIEDQTYRQFRFDLCRGCHRALLDRPLG